MARSPGGLALTRKGGWESRSGRQAGLRSYGQRKEFGFYSRYNGKLPEDFKEGVTGPGLPCKKVTVTE